MSDDITFPTGPAEWKPPIFVCVYDASVEVDDDDMEDDDEIWEDTK